MSNILETIPNHTFIFHNQGTEVPSLTDKYSSTDFVIMKGDNRITSGTNFDVSFPQDANGLRFPKFDGTDQQNAETQICVFPHECVNFGSDDFTLSEWVKFDETQHTGGTGTYVFILSFAYNAANSIVLHTLDGSDELYVYEITPNSRTYISSSHILTTNLTNFIVSRSGDVMHFYMNGVEIGTHTLTAGLSLPTPATSYTTQNSNLYTIGSSKPRRHPNHTGFNLYRTDIWKNLGITTQSEINKIYAQGIYEQFNNPNLNILETIPNHTFIFHNQGTEAPSLTDKYSSTDFVIMYGDNRITSGTEFDESFPQDANGLRFPKFNGPDSATANTQICVFPHECVNFGSDDFTLSEWVKFDQTQHTGGTGTYVYFISFAYNAANSLVFQTSNGAATMYVYETTAGYTNNFDTSHILTTNLTNFIVSRSGDVMHFYMNGVEIGTHTLTAGLSLPTPATSYTTQNSNLYTIGSSKPRRHPNHTGFNLYRTDIWKNLGITTQSEIDKIYAQGIYEQFNKPLLEKENVDIEISKNFIINKTS